MSPARLCPAAVRAQTISPSPRLSPSGAIVYSPGDIVFELEDSEVSTHPNLYVSVGYHARGVLFIYRQAVARKHSLRHTCGFCCRAQKPFHADGVSAIDYREAQSKLCTRTAKYQTGVKA